MAGSSKDRLLCFCCRLLVLSMAWDSGSPALTCPNRPRPLSFHSEVFLFDEGRLVH
jgi:hypothetical protein